MSLLFGSLTTLPSPIPTTPPPPPPPPSPPPPSSSAFVDVALRDMRKEPGTYSGVYFPDSYATNPDGALLLRISQSAFNTRAVLMMGRYGRGVDAFNASINPDYPEISYVPIGHPSRSYTYTRVTAWDQCFLSASAGASPSGYTGNSRVMIFGCELWVKKYSTNAWARLSATETASGEAWQPNFEVYGGNTLSPGDGQYFDRRVENYSGSKTTVRPYPSLGLIGGSYYVPHCYHGMTTVDTADIKDICSISRTSLIKHDSGGTDDRSSARFIYAVGADWCESPEDTGDLAGGFSGAAYPRYGSGCSKHKLVTAQWPDYQTHVMHTCTWADFQANPIVPFYSY